MKNKIWEVDDDYRYYVDSHHPEAIEFIKKNILGLKNKGRMWIDICEYTEFSYDAPDGKRLPGTQDIILFKKIIFEVFTRKINPNYVKNDYEHNRYLTWKAATEDISKQRTQGIKGKKWIVECGLDIKRGASHKIQVSIPERVKYIDNPEYEKYLQSDEYKRYNTDYAEYELKINRYKANRRNYYKFNLPNGSVKEVLLFLHPEEKYKQLRELGVKDEEIEASKLLLEKPIKPEVPKAPDERIRLVVPAHMEEKIIPGKWIWKHYIKRANPE